MSIQRFTVYRYVLVSESRWARARKNISFYRLLPFLANARLGYCVLFILFSSYASAQRGHDWRTNVDIIVERADSLSLKSQRTFYMNRIIRKDRKFKNDETVRETWYYTISEGKVVIFQVRYLIDSTEYTETYYLNNGYLVCLELYEIDFFSPYDEINWGKVLFFDNSTLKLNVSVGHRKAQDGTATTNSEAIDIFNKRYTELLRNIRLMVNG